MFSTCLHCHSALGANERIEHFPVGRRLAFDAAKGRLWVVCLKCKRWNLTPLEERWEAIEECERLYSATPLRASTDNIGLARLSDGLDVVRIGAPKTPEMAAWRYARDFGRRWVTNGLPLTFLAAGGLQGLNQAFTMSSIADPAMIASAALIVGGAALSQLRWRRIRIALPNGVVVRLSPLQYRHFHLEPAASGWAISTGDPEAAGLIDGASAVPALRSVITARNYAGAPPSQVEAAIRHLADARRPDRFIARLAHATKATGIGRYPPDIALALEMALHEDTERSALDGELAVLREEWALADEIAHIADNLLLSSGVRERLKQLTMQTPS